jgi:hypothetical protein
MSIMWRNLDPIQWDSDPLSSNSRFPLWDNETIEVDVQKGSARLSCLLSTRSHLYPCRSSLNSLPACNARLPSPDSIIQVFHMSYSLGIHIPSMSHNDCWNCWTFSTIKYAMTLTFSTNDVSSWQRITISFGSQEAKKFLNGITKDTSQNVILTIFWNRHRLDSMQKCHIGISDERTDSFRAIYAIYSSRICPKYPP